MKIILNSRTIVGPQHAQATAFVNQWSPGTPVELIWLESPSDHCALDVEIPPGQSVFRQGSGEAIDRHDALCHLEIELRENLGMPPYRTSEGASS